MYTMYKGDCKFKKLDNERYPMKFTDAKALLRGFLNKQVTKYLPKDQ
jgi:hypothetical protein